MFSCLGARGGARLRPDTRRHVGYRRSRPDRERGGAKGKGVRLQRNILRPVPARRHREITRSEQGVHTAGPAVPVRLRVVALHPQRAQPPPDQRLHHQTDAARRLPGQHR